MTYPISKRTIDIIGSILGIIFIIPFFPFIVLAIIFESGCPIFVKLDRISEGKIIKVYKFRSMIQGAHAMKQDLIHMNERIDGPLFKMKDDPRLTHVGRFLRKLRVDEFPQLLNVIRGELALIGPRPHEPEEIAKYPDEFKHIQYARAGLTGLSQVSGASSLSFMKELELDSFYIKNQSLWFDIKIFFKTIFIFFSDPTGV
ncbi:sugar transferase [Candidatus Parcubacteria bacterium]|jgi:lipopolysaccharide/colanic/teichoic acid biosynthesis glycosyltransferase|nr:MAG: sugar transferase [Candidatus Parcubacteria bacterium]